ncbi:MAG: tetratricopeptide repeat protein [Planctomycetota bacterium]
MISTKIAPLGTLFLAILTAGLVFALGFFPAPNEDLGLHLRTGDYILSHLEVPKLNVFSAVNDHYRMTDDKWLFQVVVSLIYRTAGFHGLVLFRLALLAVLFVFLASLEFDRRYPVASLLPVALAALVANERFMVRPDLPSLLFVALTLGCLRKEQRGASRRWLYAIPFIHLLWVNIHGYFIAAFMVLGCFWVIEAAGAFRARFAKDIATPHAPYSPQRLRDYSIVIGLCAAASFINPDLHRGALFPLQTLSELWGSAAMLLQGIPEFFSPWGHFAHGSDAILAYRMLVLLGTPLIAIAWLAPRLRRGAAGEPREGSPPLAYLLLFALFLVMSCKLRRNIAQFGIVAAPLLVLSLQSLSRLLAQARTRWSRRLALVAPLLFAMSLLYMLLDVTSNRFHFRNRSARVFSAGAAPIIYPEGAFRFIKEAGLKGNVFNSFGVGSWFVFACYPERRPFIDGNTFGYDIEFYKVYYDALMGITPYQELAREYTISYFLFASLEANPEVVRSLYRDPAWSLVYFDGNTFVFLARTPENAATIERYALDLGRLTRPEIEAQIARFDPEHGLATRISRAASALLGVPTAYPYVRTMWGYFLAQLGYPLMARDLLQAALDENRDYTEAAVHLGWVLGRLGDTAGGIALVQEALEASAGWAGAHAVLAGLYFDAHRPADAVTELREALELEPRARAYTLRLAEILQDLGRRPEARSVLEAGLQYNPADAHLLSRLIAVCIELGALDEADRFLRMLRCSCRDSANALYFSGLLLEARGLWHEAAASYEAYLRRRPGLYDVLQRLGVCQMKLGHRDQAIRSLEQSLAADPPEAARLRIQTLLEKARTSR